MVYLTVVTVLFVLGASYLLWQSVVSMKTTQYNLRLLTIYQRTTDIIFTKASENDVPLEDTVTALNAAVDTYNERLIGKDREEFKLQHFPSGSKEV